MIPQKPPQIPDYTLEQYLKRFYEILDNPCSHELCKEASKTIKQIENELASRFLENTNKTGLDDFL